MSGLHGLHDRNFEQRLQVWPLFYYRFQVLSFLLQENRFVHIALGLPQAFSKKSSVVKLAP